MLYGHISAETLKTKTLSLFCEPLKRASLYLAELVAQISMSLSLGPPRLQVVFPALSNSPSKVSFIGVSILL
jgi:hypothetical protein